MTSSATIDGFYHQALGFPDGVLEAIAGQFQLLFSSHARHALGEDRYIHEAIADGRQGMPGRFNITDLAPRSLHVNPAQVIEVEVTGGAPVKAIVRVPVTGRFDLVLALLFKKPLAVVKTVWLNRKSDNHKTLRTAAYRKP